jgi:hypothetical protein
MNCTKCNITINTSKNINYKCCYCHTYYYYCDGCLENDYACTCPECGFCRCGHCYGRNIKTLKKCTCGQIHCGGLFNQNRQYCSYCGNYKLHIISKWGIERSNCICCHCIIEIKNNIGETKKLLNKVFCDPSKIIEEYLDDEIYNGSVVKKNFFVKQFVKSLL